MARLKNSMQPWALFHAGVAVLVCIVSPAASWMDGSGSRAWTMYSRSSTYRLRITAFDADGRSRSVAPSELASRSERNLASVLAGSESFRRGPQGFVLRGLLAPLAELACTGPERAERVMLSLDERETLDAPPRRTSATRQCVLH
jgi:hypothetical protein